MDMSVHDRRSSFKMERLSSISNLDWASALSLLFKNIFLALIFSISFLFFRFVFYLYMMCI